MARQLDAAIGAGRVHVDVPVRERARDDAVVVAGIALRGHHALPAARRAALVVRVVERLRIEHVDEPLRLHRHLVHRAIGEVDDLLRDGRARTCRPGRRRRSGRCRWPPWRSRAAAPPACRRSPGSSPAKPPLPTARNLPFQFSVGSHSSTLMFESGVGFSTSVTRQCCGIGCGGGRGLLAAGRPQRRRA